VGLIAQTTKISELPRCLAENVNVKRLKKYLMADAIRVRGLFFMQQNKDRLAGFLLSNSYKAKENLISGSP
jgi:hypothetical protein